MENKCLKTFYIIFCLLGFVSFFAGPVCCLFLGDGAFALRGLFIFICLPLSFISLIIAFILACILKADEKDKKEKAKKEEMEKTIRAMREMKEAQDEGIENKVIKIENKKEIKEIKEKTSKDKKSNEKKLGKNSIIVG